MGSRVRFERLNLGCVRAMWAVTVSVWVFTYDMVIVTGDVWDVTDMGCTHAM